MIIVQVISKYAMFGSGSVFNRFYLLHIASFLLSLELNFAFSKKLLLSVVKVFLDMHLIVAFMFHKMRYILISQPPHICSRLG